ncbi:hypothetical protein BSKO_06442 [Bryopsis sp. KO-2023]|nr:hypothetical protein BSKO_06442 [Bryopsis sp. KO-2023]
MVMRIHCYSQTVQGLRNLVKAKDQGEFGLHMDFPIVAVMLHKSCHLSQQIKQNHSTEASRTIRISPRILWLLFVPDFLPDFPRSDWGLAIIFLMAARQLPIRFPRVFATANTTFTPAWTGGKSRITTQHPAAATMDARKENTTRLLIVGDVHNAWDEEDVAAVSAIAPDLTIFVGDIGNENVKLVRRIAEGDFPKAVLLGNHDSFFTTLPAHRVGPEAMYRDPADQDPVNDQLDLLGDDHIGFSTKEIPSKAVTVVGARPFSWGGPRYKNQWRLYSRLYGLASLEEYIEKIHDLAMGCPKENAIVMIGHCGPKGLGSEREDICGVDFGKPKHGDDLDWGDEDMAEALEKLKKDGRSPALVAFGHMHAEMNGGGCRRRVVFDQAANTLFLNAAVVPRVVGSLKKRGSSRRHFCCVDLADGCVESARDIWVRVEEGECVVEEEQRLFRFAVSKTQNEGVPFPMVFDTNVEKWTRCS